jgi:hypothetical protein
VVSTVIFASSPARQPDSVEAAAVDVVDEEFLALICADEELLRAEFDAIITASWGQPRPPAPRPRASGPALPSGPRSRCHPVDGGMRVREREPGGEGHFRQRAPPRPACNQTRDANPGLGKGGDVSQRERSIQVITRRPAPMPR